jgi:hypothetical protein
VSLTKKLTEAILYLYDRIGDKGPVDRGSDAKLTLHLTWLKNTISSWNISGTANAFLRQRMSMAKSKLLKRVPNI